mgnify:CR=1 FL=1
MAAADAAKLQVDAATLRARNPRLVYAELSAYGDDDPRALVFEDRLRAAQHMARRREGDRDGADLHRLAIGQRLLGLPRFVAVARGEAAREARQARKKGKKRARSAAAVEPRAAGDNAQQSSSSSRVQ